MISGPAPASAAIATGPTAVQRFAAIEARIDTITQDATSSPVAAAAELLRLGEEVMEIWIAARGEIPTQETKEGFRLIALHRQGAKREPSFNACRETARELVYHYNLIVAQDGASTEALCSPRRRAEAEPSARRGEGAVVGVSGECAADRAAQSQNPVLSSRRLSPGPIVPILQQGDEGSMDPSNECRDDTAFVMRRAQAQTIRMMALVAKHLVYFVDGKMHVEGLGEFCCAAKPVRAADERKA